MRNKHLLVIGLVTLSLIAVTSTALASTGSLKSAPTFAEAVRQATPRSSDVGKAEKAGTRCSTAASAARKEGAMGIHYAGRPGRRWRRMRSIPGAVVRT